MNTARTRTHLEERLGDWRGAGLSVGFVPTMGALHDGHVALVRLALEKTDRVVVSIFVNPAQFAPNEDFSAYPRKEVQDLEKLQQAGAHLAYLPDVASIYPDGRESTVKAGPAAQGLESASRPHFFDGVVNVVHRLFAQVRPAVAIFGEKDFQQLQVIKEMVATHNLPVEVVGAPTVRDADGLALSSRNAYLSPGQMAIARTLNRILAETACALAPSEAPVHGAGSRARAQPLARQGTEVERILQDAARRLRDVGFDKVDYIDVRWGRLLVAVWLGNTRLIDNVAL